MSEQTKPSDGGPAFPCPAGHATEERYQPGFGGYTSTVEVCRSGMSLRAYFAGQFAVGLVTFENGERLSHLFETKEERAAANRKQEPEEFFAQVAVQLADALIAELNK